MPSSPSATDRLIEVAVPVPGLGLLSYRVAGSDPPPPKGARVVVPLGTRRVTGCVVRPHVEPPPGADVRDVIQVLDRDPFLPPVVVDLALWVAEYYAAGPGDALLPAMPPAARRGRPHAFRTVTRAAFATASSAGPPGPRTAGPKQQAALRLLQQHASGLTLPELLRHGVSTATVRSLARHGLVSLSEEVVERDPFDGDEAGAGRWTMASAVDRERLLTPEQAQVFRHLEEAASAGVFRTLLLHGVTGSGKTELYLRLAHLVAERGRQILMLVPEIALTPAMSGQFRAWFGGRVAIQHSALSEGERHDQWHRIRRGEIDFVIGTRSAVFAPLTRIGLIIVDEEHDSSYKQEEAPRYHGRDVAVMRGRMEGAVVLLGSATPSLESAANARAERYEALRLRWRILDRPLASVRIVDMRQEYAAHGPDVTISGALTDAIGARLRRGEQTLVLLNRRGFASVIFCRQCGSTLECPHCSVALTWHRAVRQMRCHYCNYATRVPRTCGICGGEYLEQSGFGTERLESDVRERFPDAAVARVDRDTIRRRGAIARVLRDVAAGAIDIVVGTQMIAKGHDFPAVTLVGVISADVGLGLADFRASERTFQLLTQVVGRAGRGQVPGEAIIQTLYPDHYSIRAAAAQDYDAFFTREIEFRRNLQYPPAVALINVIVKGKTFDAAMTDALDLVKLVRHHGGARRVLGPAPAALARLKDEFRVQFLVKGHHRREMRRALAHALDARPELRRRTLIDVDPVTTL